MGVLVICIAALLGSVMAQDSENKEVTIISIDNCAEYSDLSTNLSVTSLQKDPFTNVFTMSGTLSITEPAYADKIKGYLIIDKCLAQDDQNSCTKNVQFEIRDFCDHIANKKMPWAPILAAMKDFVPECPIYPGEYTIDNAVVDATAPEWQLVTYGIARMQVKIYYSDEEDIPQMCVALLADIKKKKRKRTRKPAKKPERPADAFRRAPAESGGL